MRETQKRIKAYQESLPHLRERVTAVATLLLIAVSMVVSATFAWVTLSTEPEISGLATTIAANGNLEIALSNPDGTQPDATVVGDGRGSITDTNLKWGNLVNLSHESYGLDYLTLRPASLNTAALAFSPMFAVNYAEDGRIEGYQTDFSFSNYNAGIKAFEVPDTTQYGVRAISSVTYSNAHAASFYTKQLEQIMTSMADAKTKFSNIYGNSTYMNTVSSLVGVHVSVTLDGNDVSCLGYMSNLEKMIEEFGLCVDAIGQVYVDIVNMRLYSELSGKGNASAYESLAYTLEDIQANNYNNEIFNKYGASVTGLTEYKRIALEMQRVNAGMVNARKNPDGDVKWKRDLQAVANRLCNMTTATLDDMTVSELVQDKMKVVGMLSGTHNAKLNDGLLKDVDQMLGKPTLYVPNMKITARAPDDYPIVGGDDVTITANIMTGAVPPYTIPEAYTEAYNFSNAAAGNDRGTAVAADTYAMAIDFWVRTNEENALLMLEGDIKYHTEYVPITGVDEQGNKVNLYTFKDADGNEVVIYKLTAEDNTVTWHDSNTHEQVSIGSAVPMPLNEEIKTPIGYEGVNRVWDELDDPDSDYSQMIQSGTSTTQGSGSCYIFYPETPEDQEQSLHLLEAMTVAFISEDGRLLGQATMDTYNALVDAGRVIVPLQMQAQNPIVVGYDAAGEITESYYITPMVQNQPQRITAIVYLNGISLANSDVLAAGSINGQLNIQFGLNKMEKAPLKDSAVMDDYYTIAFARREFTFDSFDPANCEIDLEMTLMGSEPHTVTGSFISYISASQGARQKEFTMTFDENTKTWKAKVPFTSPGNFKLRSLQLDGVDVLLPESQMVSVFIRGLSVDSLTCTNWGGDGKSQSIMTADAVYRQEMILSLSSSSGTIPEVQGVFIGKGENVTVNFSTENGSVYVGYANFTSGGIYKLTYVIIDGVYTPINESMYKTLELTLNLRTTVVLGQPVDQAYYDLLEAKNAALAAASTDEERLQIEADYTARINAHLDVLHNGNGIAGDENEKGMELIRDSDGNMSFVTDCSEPLFMDVYCMIMDDQDKALDGLGDVELMYSAGGITNVLDSDMSEQDNVNYYVGRFTVESNGLFSFRQVSFKKQGRSYTITRAVEAPTITAIQPEPMEYVEQPAYEELVYDLGRNANQRLLYIKLKNAAAASLDLTLTNGEGNTYAPAAITAGEPDANNVTTFAIQVPDDGSWTITGAKAKNVFYNGTFYTGTEDPATWLDMTQWVVADDISSTFITEAIIKIEGGTPSQSNNGAFMADHKASQANNPMTVSVLGYANKPLEEVLRSAGIDADVSFDLQFALAQESFNYQYALSSGAALPASTFGVQSVDENGKITMEPMNFLLPGTYHPTWSIRVDDKADVYDYEFTYSDTKTLPSMFQYENADCIRRVLTVSWSLPDLRITAVDKTEESFSVNLGSDSVGRYRAMSGIYNYFEPYYANVYIETASEGEHTFPNVTMKLAPTGETSQEAKLYAFKTGTTASVVLPNGKDSSYNVNYSFNSGNAWSDKKAVGTQKGYGVPDRVPIGNQVLSAIQLTYGGVTYTVPLYHSVNVKQDEKPIYLEYSMTTDKASAPATVVSPDGRPLIITLAGTGTWQETTTSSAVLKEPDYVTNGTTQVSKYNSGGCGGDGSYDVYNRSTRTGEEVAEVTTTVSTMTVKQWTINGTNYAVGDSVTITSAQTAQAVNGAISSNSTKQNVTYTVTQTFDKYNKESASKVGTEVDTVYTEEWTETSRVEKSRS